MSKPSLFKSFLFLFLISYLKTQGAEQKTQAIVQTQEGQVKEINPMPELIKIFKECCDKAKLDANFNRYGIGYYCEALLVFLIFCIAVNFYAIPMLTKQQTTPDKIGKCLKLFVAYVVVYTIVSVLRLNSIRTGFKKEFQGKLADFLKQAFVQQPSGVSFETCNHKVDALLNWALASNLPEERRAKVFTQRLEQIVKSSIFADSMIRALQKEVLANTPA